MIQNSSADRPGTAGSVRPKKRFHTGWLLAFAIPLLLVAGILFVFSKFLYGVEYYSPTVELEEYVQTLKSKDYVKALDILGIKTTPLNGIAEYTAFFDKYYGDKIENYVFVERKLQETDKDVFYDVSINRKVPQKFRLTKTGVKRMYWFDTWKLTLVDEFPMSTVVINTIPGVVLSVNGNAVGEEYLLPEPAYVLNYYKSVKDDSKNLPVVSYKISGLIGVSSIEAVSGTGEKCTVSLLEDKDNVMSYLVKTPVPVSQEDGIKAAGLEITKKYSEFIAKDLTFSQLQPYLYKNTLFYDNLREFYNGWFTGHDSYGFENIRYFGLEWFDDKHCKVGIEMNYYVYKSEKRFDYPIKYNVYLLKVGNKWLLADLSIQ
ncbi:MAG: hypothetical protein ACYCYM_12820 [Saccharofermentanales bacterium]